MLQGIAVGRICTNNNHVGCAARYRFGQFERGRNQLGHLVMLATKRLLQLLRTDSIIINNHYSQHDKTLL
ncbi:hypothetical protein GALL_554870 [mine drainage metagenome]|uniref:Uncharacterized protein n=1 Tax=mine drainage metagenome TaxID=410659 RepID=A0A1J5PCM7_9ZZZZ